MSSDGKKHSQSSGVVGRALLLCSHDGAAPSINWLLLFVEGSLSKPATKCGIGGGLSLGKPPLWYLVMKACHSARASADSVLVAAAAAVPVPIAVAGGGVVDSRVETDKVEADSCSGGRNTVRCSMVEDSDKDGDHNDVGRSSTFRRASVQVTNKTRLDSELVALRERARGVGHFGSLAVETSSRGFLKRLPLSAKSRHSFSFFIITWAGSSFHFEYP